MYSVTFQYWKIVSSHVSSDNSPIPHAGGLCEETWSCDVWPSFEQTHATSLPTFYYAEVRHFAVSLLSFTKLTRLQRRSSSLRGSGGGGDTNRRDAASERETPGRWGSLWLSVCVCVSELHNNTDQCNSWTSLKAFKWRPTPWTPFQVREAHVVNSGLQPLVARFSSSTLALCMLTPTLLILWQYHVNTSSTTL